MLQVPVCLPRPLALGSGALVPPAGRNQASLRYRSESSVVYWVVWKAPRGPSLGGEGHLGPEHPEETEDGYLQGQLHWREQ